MSAQQVLDLHRELFAPLGKGARDTFGNDRSAGRRLHIGYVTADFHHQHPVNLFMQPVLARHDKDQFEVTVYFTGATIDDQTRLAKSRVSRWRDISKLDDGRLAKQIEADGIDVLVDLLGHTTANRRILFARRAAPVQATFLGYPSSTGLPNMDWIVADGHMAPAGSEALFSERVARLPHCAFCYSPEDDYPYPEYGPVHARRPLTFGSFNNVTKLTPSTIALWAKVLYAVPGSRLLLKAPSFMDPGARQRFTELFVAQGVDAARIECRGPSPLHAMMAEYADIDIALDAWPYNGGTTTYQALWMGVPVVTLAGEGFWRRMGASILHAIGRPEWVAHTPEQFVQLAKQLADKRLKLLTEKKALRARMQASAALNIDQYVRDLEHIYRRMWADWCEQAR